MGGARAGGKGAGARWADGREVGREGMVISGDGGERGDEGLEGRLGVRVGSRGGEDWACLSGAGMSIRCDNPDHLRDPGEFVHHLLLKTTWPA